MVAARSNRERVELLRCLWSENYASVEFDSHFVLAAQMQASRTTVFPETISMEMDGIVKWVGRTATTNKKGGHEPRAMALLAISFSCFVVFSTKLFLPLKAPMTS